MGTILYIELYMSHFANNSMNQSSKKVLKVVNIRSKYALPNIGLLLKNPHIPASSKFAK
jgi:hypothetical protein